MPKVPVLPSSQQILADLKKTALIYPLEEVLGYLGESPVVSVSNRSTIKVCHSPGEGPSYHRTSGGVGSSMELALQRYGHGLVYSTAMTMAEEILARSNLVISKTGKVWTRFVSVPQKYYRHFYDSTTNLLLYMILHGRPEKLLPTSQLSELENQALKFLNDDFSRSSSQAPHSFHGRVGTNYVEFVYSSQKRRAYEEGYHWVNLEYAKILAKDLGNFASAKLLLHDHHFSLLPKFLRRQGYSNPIAHFIHVPWPEADVIFFALPSEVSSEIVSGLMANNVLGFHTHTYARNFQDTAAKLFGDSLQTQDNMLVYDDNGASASVNVVVNPIPVDIEHIITSVSSASAVRFVKQLRRQIGERILIVRCERIDMMKGLYEGLVAFEILLKRYYHLRSELQMFAVLQPSRLHIPEYRIYYEQVHELTNKINREFRPSIDWNGIICDEDGRKSMFDSCEWPPIVLFECEKQYEETIGAMAAANIGVFNSLADGMNLSIKEFATVNDPLVLKRLNHNLSNGKGSNEPVVSPGIAIASVSMGAFEELQQYVLNVADPENSESLVSVMYEAVNMVTYQQDEVRKLAFGAAKKMGERTMSQWLNYMMISS